MDDIDKAMLDPDALVVRMRYTDMSGNQTERFVSPIRYHDNLVLAFCLCRGQPQWFVRSRITDAMLFDANTVQMPLEIIEIRNPEC